MGCDMTREDDRRDEYSGREVLWVGCIWLPRERGVFAERRLAILLIERDSPAAAGRNRACWRGRAGLAPHRAPPQSVCVGFGAQISAANIFA